MRLLILLVIGTALLVVGCGKSDEKKNADDQYKTPLTGTAAGQVIEDMTGMTQAKAGREAAEKLRKIGAQENKDLNEVMDNK